MHRTAVLALLAGALAALLAWAGSRALPVDLPAAGASRLPCVSYAPFRRPGDSPFDPALQVAPAQIEADLRLLARVTGCVRTYGLDHGIDAVPEIARKLGLRVILGAWIGRDPAANEMQLARALELARTHGDVIDMLVIGNEVLLRRELTPQALAALLDRARQATAVPVAYADVWEFWLRHAPVLQGHVDVVVAHILPYWEDRPVGVEQAVDHVYEIAAELDNAFAPLPVYIGETGWPAAGRQRGPAVPGTLEQTRFVRELVARQAVRPLPLNLIEGFDQPWKRALEGAMGGAWGVFDAGGESRVTLAGPVVPDARAKWVLAGAGLGAAAGLLAFALMRRRRAHAAWQGAVLTLAGALTGALGVVQWQALEAWSRSGLEWTLGGLTAAAAALCSIAAGWRLAGVHERCRPARTGIAAALRTDAENESIARADFASSVVAVNAATARADFTSPVPAVPRGTDAPEDHPSAQRRRFLHGLSEAHGTRVVAWVVFVWLFAVAAMALGLVFDPRYRPLEWWNLAGGATLLFALALAGDGLAADAREERVLAAVCALCAPAIALQEGASNTQAQLVAGLLLLLAAAVLRPHRRAPSGRASTSAASSTAGADSSVE